MSEDVEGPARLIASGISAGEGNWQDIATVLASVPEGEIRTVLEKAAGEHGAVSVPLLEQLAGGVTSSVALAAVYALGTVADTTAASALQRVASATSSTDLRKSARRVLHRLASKGVVPAVPEVVRPEAPSPRAAAVYKALASPIDGAGNRGIWFAFHRGGELDFVSLLLNDERGVGDAFVRDSSVQRFDRDSRQLLEDKEFPWIEMPPDYCRHLVEVAHRRNASSSTPLPVEYLAWHDKISRAEAPYDQPIIYSVMSAAEVRWEPRYLDNSGNLFDLDLFKGWILDKDELGEFVQQKLSAERSGLVLAGVSGEARNRMVGERAIQTLFDARRREVYKGRLEEMSYVLWKLGRLEAARQALAAAMALGSADYSLLRQPFVQALVSWSLDVVTEMARGERTKAVRPGVQLLLPY